MQKLETVGAVHTGYITKINRLEPKKNIWLFSNVLFLHTQKVCGK